MSRRYLVPGNSSNGKSCYCRQRAGGRIGPGSRFLFGGNNDNDGAARGGGNNLSAAGLGITANGAGITIVVVRYSAGLVGAVAGGAVLVMTIFAVSSIGKVIGVTIISIPAVAEALMRAIGLVYSPAYPLMGRLVAYSITALIGALVPVIGGIIAPRRIKMMFFGGTAGLTADRAGAVDIVVGRTVLDAADFIRAVGVSALVPVVVIVGCPNGIVIGVGMRGCRGVIKKPREITAIPFGIPGLIPVFIN